MDPSTASSPLNRFSDRVRHYALHRPSYPPELLEFLKDCCGLQATSRIADIGSGTGIFTRLLLNQGGLVFGIEPNAEMRAYAQRDLATDSNFNSLSGTAEQTGLEDASVDLITAAQAFHWFVPGPTRKEFQRVLKPGGWVALIWNDRDASHSPFLKEYETFLLEHGTDYQRVNHLNLTRERFIDFFQSDQFILKTFPHHQVFDSVGLLGRVLSSSYCPNETHPAFPKMREALQTLFDRHSCEGQIRFEYQAKVVACRLG